MQKLSWVKRAVLVQCGNCEDYIFLKVGLSGRSIIKGSMRAQRRKIVIWKTVQANAHF